MNKIIKLKQELIILKTLGIKPNYSQLARKHKCDRRTVKKYNEGYEGEPKIRNKSSKLDRYIDDVKEKLNLSGATISGTYQYIKEKDNLIGTYSNFYQFVKKKKLQMDFLNFL